MKLNLETIVIFVQNIEKLKIFYTHILELEIIEEIESQWVLFKAGNANIGLHKIGEQYWEGNKEEFKANSNTKIVFEIEEDIYEIRKKIIDKNVFLREVKTFDNYDFLLCDGEDPEGNVFQLKQKKN